MQFILVSFSIYAQFNIRSFQAQIKQGSFCLSKALFKPTSTWLHPSYIDRGINVYSILFLPYCHTYGFSLFILCQNYGFWSYNLIILHRFFPTGFHTTSGHSFYLYWPGPKCIWGTLCAYFYFIFLLYLWLYKVLWLPSSNLTSLNFNISTTTIV